MSSLLPWLIIDESRQMPVYLQIVNAFKSAIAAGELRAHQAIPSERTLAERLTLARGTVSKAYEVLVDEAIIQRRRGLAPVIAGNAAVASKEALVDQLNTLLEQVVHTARDLDLNKKETLQRLEEQWTKS